MSNYLPQWMVSAKGLLLALMVCAGFLIETTEAQAQCTYGWGYVYVTAPTAGQSYTRNTTMTIRWYGDRYVIGNYGGKYRIEYSSNGGGTWNVIDGAVDGYAGSYNWLIPATIPPGTNYYFRVSEAPGPSWSCAFSYPGTNGPVTILKGCFPPTISVQPTSRTSCVGTSTTFSVTSDLVDGTWEWRKNGIAIATTTSPSYTIPSVQLSHAGLYDCVLRDNCNTTTAVTTSGACQLTVIEAPVVTTQMPATRLICENNNDTLRIRATGAGKTFQWFKNGVAIAGATDSNYVIVNATSVSADGAYTCVVTGTCTPPAVSTPCAVTVVSRPRITLQPTNLDICPGTNGALTVAAAGNSLTYQWYKDGVAVPNGFNPTLNFTNYAYTSNGEYYCIVTSNVPNPNRCVAIAQSATVRVSGFRAPTVTESPDSADACIGSTVTLLSEFTGSGLTYQWYKNGAIVPNAASNSLTISPVTAAATGDYYVKATGTCNLTVNSAPARITAITKPTFAVQPQSQRLTVGDRMTLTVDATDMRMVQWTKNDQPIAGATSSTFTIERVGKSDAGYYNALVRNSCGGISSAYANITVVDPQIPEPVLELSSSNVDFGEIPVGYDKSVTLNGLIKNIGTAPLVVSGLSTTPNEFTITNGPTLPLTLAPGASEGVTLKASPTVKGTLAGSLNIQSNSPSNPTATVTLAAAYVLRYKHDASEDYGVVLTDASLERCIALTNESTMDISIEQATLTGANAGQFTVNTTLPLAIAAGQSADICVTFAPGTDGTKSATLNLRSSSGGNSSVALSGKGELAGGVVDAVDAGITAWPNPMTDRVEVRFAKPTPAMQVSVMSSTGRAVTTFSHDGVDAGGTIRWNGRDASGAAVAAGSYTMVIRYGDTAISLPLTIIR